MKKIILLVVVIGFIFCNFKTSLAQEKVVDNLELIEMFKCDQADRTNHIDRDILQKNDSFRETRVYELLDSNKVHTSLDFHNAALIFHHGEDSVAYAMAVKLMRTSMELDSTRNKWYLAVLTDRYLLSINKPQIYGTHYKRLDNNIVVREEMDTTIITDAERVEYGVETLAEQKEKLKNLNRKKLTELLDEGKTIDEIILIVKQGEGKESQYDLRENWINNFGYQLLNQGDKEDALKIFKLNTELYPKGYNTFDSYGECLLELGDKENAIIAFKKSLELNPKNENAKTKLSGINGQAITPKYNVIIRTADSLYQVKDYTKSAFAFSDAFKAPDAKITINHRYNAVCSWALANYPDSAFFNLNYIVTWMNYTNLGLMKSDPDLISLHNDKRWNPLLEIVLANKKKAFPSLELIPVNGFKIEIITYGMENNQKGKPVIVFENGRGTDFEYWLPIIKDVSQENSTFAYNRPRIGGSEDDNQLPTIDHIPNVLRQSLRAKGLFPPYILVGHSWGAAYIRTFASLYPDEIAGLIFVDPHDFVKKEAGGRSCYREIGLTTNQIDSLFSTYDKSADEYIAQGPKFVVEEMKAQREFGKTGYELCNRNPIPDVPVHFIMAGGYPLNPEQTASLYDRKKMFRINNDIKMENWLEIINPLSYGKFFYCSNSGHIIPKDDPDIIISSIKLALQEYDKIKKE